MAFKSKRSTAGSEVTFFYDDEVCKHGDFIKSPPPQLFMSQSSWKKRCFILCKTNKRCFTLKYLKGQQIKGSIAVEQIRTMESGIRNYEKMTAVRKMFKCHPEEVISIITEARDYYLIGKDREQVEDWITSLSSAWKEAKEDGCCAQNQNPAAPRGKGRSSSSPPSFHETAMATQEENRSNGNEIEVEDSAEDSKRPHSDPGAYGVPEQQLPSLNNNSEKTSKRQELLDSDKNTKESEEEYYVFPRSIRAQLESEQPKPDPLVQLPNPVEGEDHLSSKLYVAMKSLLPEEKLQPTRGSDEFLTLSRSQENSIHLRNCEADGNQQLTQSRTHKQLTQERKPKALSLSVVQLSIIINKVTDNSQLQEVDIYIPHADVTNNLMLTEAAGRICVSHWKGPHSLGCIFHHGDHIVAVNDLHIQNIDELSLFISRSMQKKVKLTVCRIPDSDIFHIKGCSCS